MNRKLMLLAVVAVTVFLLPGFCFGQSSGTVVDFQNVSAPTYTGYPQPFQLDGLSFRFIGYGDLQWIEDDGTGNHVMVDGGWDGNGLNNSSGAESVITSATGKPFLFHSLDYGTLTYGYGYRIDFLFLLANGGYAYRSLNPETAGLRLTAEELGIVGLPVTALDINIVSSPWGNYYYDNLNITLPNIFIGETDCGVPDRRATAQLSIQQLIQQKVKLATTHDDFQMFVAELMNSLRKTNGISKDEATKIKVCSAKSTIGS